MDVSLPALNLDFAIEDVGGLEETQVPLQEVLNNAKELKGMDSADLIRPFIENDDIRMIGAIYTEDYQACIEKDSVFAHYFQKVSVGELSTDIGNDETAQMSMGNESFSSFGESGDTFDGEMSFGISSVLVSAAQLSDRYIINDQSSQNNSTRNMMKKGRSQRLLRTQRTVSERFISLDVPSSGGGPKEKKLILRIPRPENIVALERKIFNLETHFKTLKKSCDADDEGQKEALTQEIADLNNTLEPLLIKWQAQHVNELRHAKKNLASLETKAVTAEKSGNFDSAADLKFGAIPALRTRIQELAKVFGR